MNKQSLKKYLIYPALKEDAVNNDFTTLGLGIKNLKIKAVIFAQKEGILAGVDVCSLVFKTLGKVKCRYNFKDGEEVKNGDEVIYLQGEVRNILGGERVALNFLSHLSGIATFTNKFVKMVAPNRIKIYDTRKTLPLLRKLEKYAVKVGGGYNHRIDLSSALMIKDNHINIFKKVYSGKDYIVQMVKKLKKRYPSKELILEVHNLDEWRQAIGVNPDVVMFDNWELGDIEVALKMSDKRTFEVEVSGSIQLEQLERIVELGIERVSLGCITHSAPALDFSLEVI